MIFRELNLVFWIIKFPWKQRNPKVGYGEVTNAGLLLCDQGVLRHSRVVCTHWKGKEKGEIDGDALDDQEFFGTSLIMLLNNAEAFIR